MLQPLVSLYAFLTAPRGEKGATATEYALIIAGIAVVVFGAIGIFGEKLEGIWTDLTSELDA